MSRTIRLPRPENVFAEQKEGIFSRTMAISGLIHVLVLIMIVTFSLAEPGPSFRPLAVMDFSQYDPEGGSSGGSEELAEVMEVPPPEPAPEPEPEPEPVLEPAPEIIESTAEEAPVFTPPPLEEKPPEKKPLTRRTKPKPPAPESAQPGTSEGAGSGGSGGVGGGAGRGNPDLMAAYKSQISRKLNRYKKYPPEAVAKQLNGVVRVYFRIDAQGQVSAARMTASSGQAALDQEAMALLKRCAPFPPIPKGLGLASLELNVPVSFSVRR
ncbi:MAG: TonB family protein [Deltaproteobacteria bacterium]|jgi:protein TonB|nr:TonB family protein [Deltaproteobacteria bacterium]